MDDTDGDPDHCTAVDSTKDAERERGGASRARSRGQFGCQSGRSTSYVSARLSVIVLERETLTLSKRRN
jgi:hypothetical protein